MKILQVFFLKTKNQQTKLLRVAKNVWITFSGIRRALKKLLQKIEIKNGGKKLQYFFWGGNNDELKMDATKTREPEF